MYQSLQTRTFGNINQPRRIGDVSAMHETMPDQSRHLVAQLSHQQIKSGSVIF